MRLATNWMFLHTSIWDTSRYTYLYHCLTHVMMAIGNNIKGFKYNTGHDISGHLYVVLSVKTNISCVEINSKYK